MREAARIVAERTGRALDILVNNAGMASLSLMRSYYLAIQLSGGILVYCSTVLDIDLPTPRTIFELNVFGVVLCTQVFSPLLLRSHGKIVNMGSISGMIKAGCGSMYASTKASLELISHATRIECKPLGLKVIHVYATFPIL
jgi:NAD(P)-dependent dehydrogenase (short-subunit alcohol dehydrogenase family)